MTSASFYSDRTRGPVPRVTQTIDDTVWRGIRAVIQGRFDDHSLAQEFPERCVDNKGIAGTDTAKLFDTLRALVPDAPWASSAYGGGETPNDDTIFDLLDFVGQRVALPINGKYHDYFGHYELKFDRDAGRSKFRRDIDEIFARNGIAFEIDSGMRIVRLGPPELRVTLADLQPATGDPTLDNLIEEARRRILSRDIAERRVALERLWDAFERLKTIEPGGDKKAQVGALLDRAGQGYLRTALDVEAAALTQVGNIMQIRHFETTKEPVPDEAIDYLFARLSSLVLYLLRRTQRLA